MAFDHLFKPLKLLLPRMNLKIIYLHPNIVERVSLSELTAASTGTSCPARILVSNGVMMMAPIVEHLYEFQEC